MQLEYVGIIMNLQMVLNTLKKSLHLDQPTQIILAKFSDPKTNQNRKFQTPKIL